MAADILFVNLDGHNSKLAGIIERRRKLAERANVCASARVENETRQDGGACLSGAKIFPPETSKRHKYKLPTKPIWDLFLLF